MKRDEPTRRRFLQTVAAAGAGVVGVGALGGCPVADDFYDLLHLRSRVQGARDLLEKKAVEFAYANHADAGVYDVLTRKDIYHTPPGSVLTRYVVHSPANKTTPSPVVGYAHGFFLSGESQEHLLRGIARAGYHVIAPDHPRDFLTVDRIDALDNLLVDGSDINMRELVGKIGVLMVKMLRGEIPSEREVMDVAFGERLNEHMGIMDAAAHLNATDYHLKGMIDMSKFIPAGHSLGGRTTKQMLMENPGLHPCGLAYSSSDQWLTREENASVVDPLLSVTGDLDAIGADYVIPAFEEIGGPGTLLVMKNFGHMSFACRSAFLSELGIPFYRGDTNGIDENPFTFFPDYAKSAKSLDDQAEELKLSLGLEDAVAVLSNYGTKLENIGSKTLANIGASVGFLNKHVRGLESGQDFLNELDKNKELVVQCRSV